LQVRVNSLVCIGKILEHLDKFAVMEDILPFLAQIPSREAPTLMAILGILYYIIIINVVVVVLVAVMLCWWLC
jgi:hypothetical protein